MGLIFYTGFISTYYNEYKNRYVSFFDEYVHFNSFRFRKKVQPVSLNLKYEDIWSVTARRLPLIGFWAVRINGKNLPHTITLSFCFCKHKEMYTELCNLTKLHNPNVHIDSSLEKYVKK